MLKRIALILLALGIVVFLSPANAWWVQWYSFVQNQLFDLVVDGGRIIGIALILEGLLAPFEALGWWAGWYGGKKDRTTLIYNRDRAGAKKADGKSSHFVVYLDGIGKSSFNYSFRSARFLARLKESLPSDGCGQKSLVKSDRHITFKLDYHYH